MKETVSGDSNSFPELFDLLSLSSRDETVITITLILPKTIPLSNMRNESNVKYTVKQFALTNKQPHFGS